jgi:undecaprenyl-diphosphatase
MRAALHWLKAQATLGPVVLLGLTTSSLWAFLGLLDEVSEGETMRFDTAILLAMRSAENTPIGPPALQEIMRDFTALGGVAWLTLLTVCVAGFLIMKRNTATALFLLCAVSTGILTSTVAKGLIDRPRPDLVPHGSFVTSASFPSGHSMMATLVYLTLAIVIARGQSQRRVKAYVIGIACTLALAVGVSRVYLGVHWPTDVLAGWALGSGWAIGAWLIAEVLDREHILPQDAAHKP